MRDGASGRRAFPPVRRSRSGGVDDLAQACGQHGLDARHQVRVGAVGAAGAAVGAAATASSGAATGVAAGMLASFIGVANAATAPAPVRLAAMSPMDAARTIDFLLRRFVMTTPFGRPELVVPVTRACPCGLRVSRVCPKLSVSCTCYGAWFHVGEGEPVHLFEVDPAGDTSWCFLTVSTEKRIPLLSPSVLRPQFWFDGTPSCVRRAHHETWAFRT